MLPKALHLGWCLQPLAMNSTSLETIALRVTVEGIVLVKFELDDVAITKG